MRELHVVALSEDGRHVVLATRKGAGRGDYRVAVDDRLAAAVRGDLPRPGESSAPRVTPKEIQARLRAGESVEQIAKSAGMPVTRVERFAGPVLSEREGMINRARAAIVNRTRRGPSGLPLGEAVDQHLAQSSGYRPESTEWTARREETGVWLIEVHWVARGHAKRAGWRYDPAARQVAPLDGASAALAHVDLPLGSRDGDAGAPPAPRATRVRASAPRSAPPARKQPASAAPAVPRAAKTTVRPAPPAPARPAAAPAARTAKAAPAKRAAARPAAPVARPAAVTVPAPTPAARPATTPRPAAPAAASRPTRKAPAAVRPVEPPAADEVAVEPLATGQGTPEPAAEVPPPVPVPAPPAVPSGPPTLRVVPHPDPDPEPEEPVAQDEPAAEEPEPVQEPVARVKRAAGQRASVPSWSDVLLGTGPVDPPRGGRTSD